MPTARTTGEYYRVVTDIGASRPDVLPERFHEPTDAVRHAMRLVLNTGKSCDVERVTTHEPVVWHPWGDPEVVAETVTGRVAIPAAEHFARRPELSRYHPVNGWAVPDEIEVPL